MLTRWMKGLFALTCMGFASFSNPGASAENANASNAAPTRPTGATTPFFRITIVDEQTGRGIPLVKLTTTNQAEYWTDSAGVVAFAEPEMMGRRVQMNIESYGYSTPRNMFGQQVIGFTPRAGESMTFKMRRDAVAQRLYRITGTDIYRDSQLLGDQVFVSQDPSDLPVTGMDSVITAVYRGKMYWIWGDTGITATNLGNFKSTGAVSELPGKDLDPDKGIYLTFFRNKDGRVQQMVNSEHQPIWIGGMHVVRDQQGQEHLFCSYSKIKAPLSSVEAGLAEFNDKTNQYDIVWAYPKDANVHLGGNHFRHSDGGVEYFYQTRSFPSVRCKADIESVKDIYSYEGLTCLKPGTKIGREHPATEDMLERDKDGRLVWGWRRNTSPVGPHEIQRLVEKGLATPADAPFALIDADTSQTVQPHGGSVYFNEYRKRWVATTLQTFGTSWLGEVWYFEGDTPLGPWVYGQKIITHTIFRDVKKGGRRVDEDKPEAAETYGFYNVKHHPEFDKEEGRVIYVEGTYTAQFSGAKHPTPRYNYNQMMYKVELDDPRLNLPVPVYRLGGKQAGYYTKTNLPEKAHMDRDAAIPFFAPDRPRASTFPVYQVADEKGSLRLTLEKPADADNPVVAFFAAAGDASVETTPTLAATVPLYEYTHTETSARFYSVQESLNAQSDASLDELPADAAQYRRAEKPLCRVWPNPIRFNPYKIKS